MLGLILQNNSAFTCFYSHSAELLLKHCKISSQNYLAVALSTWFLLRVCGWKKQQQIKRGWKNAQKTIPAKFLLALDHWASPYMFCGQRREGKVNPRCKSLQQVLQYQLLSLPFLVLKVEPNDCFSIAVHAHAQCENGRRLACWTTLKIHYVTGSNSGCRVLHCGSPLTSAKGAGIQHLLRCVIILTEGLCQGFGFAAFGFWAITVLEGDAEINTTKAVNAFPPYLTWCS